MATIWEETKEQTSKMKDKPFKEKLEYFWEYYKIHTLIVIGVLTILISIIHAVATSKDYGLGIVLMNIVSPDFETDYSDWQNDLYDILDLNTKKYDVFIDDSISIGGANNSGNQEYSSQQKLAALMSSKCIDILVSNTSEFEHYAQLEYFFDLREILPEETFKKYEEAGLIYYTNAATFSDYDDEFNTSVSETQASYTYDHHDKTTMADPIPVGIYVKADTKLYSKDIYIYLLGVDNYQGYPQEPILGIPVNCDRIDAAILGTNYLLSEGN